MLMARSPGDGGRIDGGNRDERSREKSAGNEGTRGIVRNKKAPLRVLVCGVRPASGSDGSHLEDDVRQAHPARARALAMDQNQKRGPHHVRGRVGGKGGILREGGWGVNRRRLSLRKIEAKQRRFPSFARHPRESGDPVTCCYPYRSEDTGFPLSRE